MIIYRKVKKIVLLPFDLFIYFFLNETIKYDHEKIKIGNLY